MAYTDRELLKQQEAGALATSGAADPIGTVAFSHTDSFAFSKASDDGMASTATTETRTGIYVPRKARLKNIWYVPTTGGITADNTNFATVTVSSRDAAGANLTTVATLTTTITSSGNLTQDVGAALVLATSAVIIAAGSTLTYSIAKSGSGVIVRAGSFTVDLEWV